MCYFYSSDGSKLQFKLKMVLPSMKIDGDYDMRGNILSLKLNGKGKASISIGMCRSINGDYLKPETNS